jgi:TonB family protein
MFEKLVITESRAKRRTGYFLSASLAAVCFLTVALVASLFAVELNLGNDNFEVTELIAPVEITPPEPEVPEAVPQPQQQVQAAPEVPTRQANIARLDESPPQVPAEVSTVKNTQKERPSSRYFEIGKIDSDPVGGATSGRSTGTSGAGGTGLSTGSNETVAKVIEEEAGPPPAIKKPAPKPKRPQSLGVINGKAVSLPVPIYSAAARAVNAQGRVSVKVHVNEQGRVVSADVISGHPLLRSAAEKAARQARFSPTLLSGEPVSVTGTIVYNFNGG